MGGTYPLLSMYNIMASHLWSSNRMHQNISSGYLIMKLQWNCCITALHIEKWNEFIVKLRRKLKQYWVITAEWEQLLDEGTWHSLPYLFHVSYDNFHGCSWACYIANLLMITTDIHYTTTYTMLNFSNTLRVSSQHDTRHCIASICEKRNFLTS